MALRTVNKVRFTLFTAHHASNSFKKSCLRKTFHVSSLQVPLKTRDSVQTLPQGHQNMVKGHEAGGFN
eukprot:10133474-Karenia_brevis.AAC.1